MACDLLRLALLSRTLLETGVLWGHFCSLFNQEAIEGAFGFFLDTFEPTLVAHLNLKDPQAATRHRCRYQLMPPSLVAIRRASKDVVLIYGPPLFISGRFHIKHRSC